MASKRATKTDAVLRHIAAGGDIGDFPGTKFENGALARSVERRGLIVWDKEGNRYVLTPAGWSALTPRRFGLPSLMVSTAVGAAVGAAVLAFLWLPGLQGRDSAYGHATSSPAAEKQVVAAAAPPVDASGRSLARVPMTATSVAPTPVSASTTVPAVTPAVAVEPPPAAVDPAAAQPVAEQPVAEPAPSSAKQPRKSHHRTVRHNDHYGNSRTRYADPRYDMGFPRYDTGFSRYSYR
jgi:hypothetical protein